MDGIEQVDHGERETGKESNSAVSELDCVFANPKLEMVSGQRQT